MVPRGISSTSGPFDPVISTDFPRNPGISMIGRPIPYILVVYFAVRSRGLYPSNPAIWMIHRPFDPVFSTYFPSNPAISIIHTRQIPILNVFTSASRFQYLGPIYYSLGRDMFSHNFFWLVALKKGNISIGVIDQV